jgi:hypothetical protein
VVSDEIERGRDRKGTKGRDRGTRKEESKEGTKK